ncbi:MAG: phosphoglycerate kinase [Planctomycetota bacterium]|nr:phosphoglycerate kinase [Planctomycetota bacterium]
MPGLDVPGLDTLDLEGKRVLIRVDFNVPLDEHGRITDDTRIRAAVPTLREVLRRGGGPVLMSHLGRPQGRVVESLRMDPVALRLSEALGRPVLKLEGSSGREVEAAVRDTPPKTTVLLENVRFHPGETRGDPKLGAAYALLGDVFVNDAFGTSHRDHASVCGPARHLPAAAGLLLQREIEAFRRVLEAPEKPFVLVLGGAKVADKLPVVGNLIERVDTIVVGGGMAYTFLVAGGRGVGTSLVDEEQLDRVRSTLEQAAATGCTILLPVDHVVAERFAADAPASVVAEIPAGTMALDIGPRTRALYAETIAPARTVVWNGPMGVFEWDSFRAGTEAVGRAVAACPGYTVVGGGDSVAAIGLLGLEGEIGHVSTGGGASLELLAGRALPGIEVLAPKVGA